MVGIYIPGCCSIFLSHPPHPIPHPPNTNRSPTLPSSSPATSTTTCPSTTLDHSRPVHLYLNITYPPSVPFKSAFYVTSFVKQSLHAMWTAAMAGKLLISRKPKPPSATPSNVSAPGDTRIHLCPELQSINVSSTGELAAPPMGPKLKRANFFQSSCMKLQDWITLCVGGVQDAATRTLLLANMEVG